MLILFKIRRLFIIMQLTPQFKVWLGQKNKIVFNVIIFHTKERHFTLVG